MDTTNARYRLANEQYQADAEHRFSPRRLGVLAFALSILGLLASGYTLRDDSYLSAADGLGYALGILGGSFMLLLLFYPLRKSLRFMHNWGPVSYTHLTLPTNREV